MVYGLVWKKEHFKEILGKTATREGALNWEEALGYEGTNLENLEFPFTEMEVFNIAKGLPSQRAPSPDGYNWGVLQNMLGYNKKMIFFVEPGSFPIPTLFEQIRWAPGLNLGGRACGSRC
jgi:hypothetical protein